ncbi:hypothetical protein [Hymenobacter busanensis]|uniref:hypothetical protein n=1 Tax=Hymenobacter busanensis TaxID=2607656 RepID=UPI001366CDA2|nr:hypothetical protein [Hymenobacter busanensis]QHJ05852.1 hypothetical protein GUY19_00485 [Hymenobacter busanensis]
MSLAEVAQTGAPVMAPVVIEGPVTMAVPLSLRLSMRLLLVAAVEPVKVIRTLKLALLFACVMLDKSTVCVAKLDGNELIEVTFVNVVPSVE